MRGELICTFITYIFNFKNIIVIPIALNTIIISSFYYTYFLLKIVYFVRKNVEYFSILNGARSAPFICPLAIAIANSVSSKYSFV